MVCRDVMRQATAHLELSLAGDINDKHIGRKRKIRESVGALLKQTGVLVMEDTVKVELVNAFFAFLFTTEAVLQQSQTSEVREEGFRKEDLPLVIEGSVRGQLGRFSTHKSMDSNGMFPWMLRELADTVAKPFSIILGKWRTGGAC